MLSPETRKDLERQQYRIIGSHSAVKICGWTKNMIKNRGGCYKLKFYGITSSQCLQMTTSLSCANRCTFCWRGYKAPVGRTWKWNIDGPELILEQSITAHHKLLKGFGGQPELKKSYKMSQTIKHVALSLTGEPIIYPRINDLIKLFHKQGISTFLVTNAQYPEQIKDLTRVTQLYLSVDAPNQILLKEIDKPLFGDYWERLNKSLEYCSQKKDRTCIRLTLIKDVNDVEPENYAKLILKGNADFIEVKAYMHVGGSRKRLKVEDMPWHEDVAEFSKRLLEYLPEYDIVSEHIPSRVVMIAKKRFKKKWKWFTWIDFDKWQKLIESEKDFNTEDFLKETPETGLSGRIIRQEVEEKIRKKIERQKSNDEMSADENTSELDLE